MPGLVAAIHTAACTGDMYGSPPTGDTTAGPRGVGALRVVPFQTTDPAGKVLTTTGPTTAGVSITAISDGTSNMVLLSEALSPESSAGWGGLIGSILYGNIGGGLFTTTITPNSSSPDRPIGPCPKDQGINSDKAPCVSRGGNVWWTRSAVGADVGARSRPSGGVNADLADGSVRFVPDGIDLGTWRCGGWCSRRSRDTRRGLHRRHQSDRRERHGADGKLPRRTRSGSRCWADRQRYGHGKPLVAVRDSGDDRTHRIADLSGNGGDCQRHKGAAAAEDGRADDQPRPVAGPVGDRRPVLLGDDRQAVFDLLAGQAMQMNRVVAEFHLRRLNQSQCLEELLHCGLAGGRRSGHRVVPAVGLIPTGRGAALDQGGGLLGRVVRFRR